MVRAVFLDRDGVINANMERDGKPVAPTSHSEFRFLPGVEAAIRQLKQQGFLIIVVTNQPDVATGRTSRAVVDAMHAEIRARMPIDDIKCCFHTDADNCDCRKPKTGLFRQAAVEYGIDLAQSYMVGDRWRDIVAGRESGCLTFLVEYGYEQEMACYPDFRVRSLSEAAAMILSHGKTGAAL